MLTIEKLAEYGADVEKGLSRCANNEALYLRLVGLCIGELSSCALGDALKNRDLDKAFEIAHKLKGGVSNLALTPIAIPICELTERLRNQSPGDHESLYNEIVKERAALSALLA
ncbi:MAG: Hpt domain-containing protein [Clostridia bacterium]|nr:Hpt domain-containing protein [Clostridia bacterium]